VLEHVNDVEMRVVVAKVPAAAAKAVVVAGVQSRAKKQLGGGEHAGEKGRGGGKM
jgi:hypothetical protein